MPRRNPIDWDALDWHRPTEIICAETGFAARYVTRRRHRHAPETVGIYRPESKAGSLAALAGRSDEAKVRAVANARLAAQSLPSRRKGVDHAAAKGWVLRDPSGVRHEFVNLLDFIRNHPELFAPGDAVWQRGPSGREWCRAATGLGRLRHGRASWKGWSYAT